MRKADVSDSPFKNILPGDTDRWEDESTAGDDGGRRCLAGLVGYPKSNWFGRIAGDFGLEAGAGVIAKAGVACIRSTGSGIKGGRSAYWFGCDKSIASC